MTCAPAGNRRQGRKPDGAHARRPAQRGLCPVFFDLICN
ncbi:hypothetical protein C7S13_3552 [Burkholderia cepacia]|nr:hypothetical protein [Burkholderia cepacia]